MQPTKKQDSADVMNDESSVTSLTSQADCYLSLPSFGDFGEIWNAHHYHALPSDWVVVITDVQNSTSYVESGRYRDVNTVGAMPIAAVRNAIGDNFPYVFGGDGSSMVVRPEQKDTAIKVLLAVQRLVALYYDMHLRVGCVSVSALEAMGARVSVARYEISSGITIAMFSGRGLAMADEIVKHGEELEQSPESAKCVPDLSGLSCRWNKVPSRYGCVLSLMISSYPGASDLEEWQIYKNVLELLGDIIALNDDSNPVNMDMADYKTAAEMIREERRMHARRLGNGAWVNRVLEIRLCHVLFNLRKLQKSIIDVAAYKQRMRLNADHRKFDDMIRMVVDCTGEQANEVENCLEGLHRERTIVYGLHRSQHSLLTCLVEDARNGKHIHFVDGDAGGYTAAAKQMKRQLEDFKGRKRNEAC